MGIRKRFLETFDELEKIVQEIEVEIKMEYPKFPIKAKPQSYERWGEQIKRIIEKQIEKDKEKMGSDLAYWFDIRPLLEALK